MKKIGLILIVVILVFSLCGCENVSDEELQKNKIEAESEYLESKILYIVNEYLTGKYFNDDQDINWDDLQKDFSQISNSTSVIVMDLATTKIDANTILEFEKNIKNSENAIYSKDFTTFFNSIIDLYNFIPEFENQVLENNSTSAIPIKIKLLSIVYYSSINDFENLKLSMNDIENEYNELIKSQDYLEKNSYKVNRIYVEIQELKLYVENNNYTEIVNKYFDIIKLL
jgi:hypothetical protein